LQFPNAPVFKLGNESVFITVIISQALLFLVLLYITKGGNNNFWEDYNYWYFSLMLGLFAVSVKETILMIVAANRDGFMKSVIQSGDNNRTTKPYFALITAVIFPLILLTSWSQSIYPMINPAFGGGRPISIQIELNDENNQNLFRKMNIQIVNNVSEPIKLMDDSNETIAVLLTNASAIRISKSYIANIIYLPYQPIQQQLTTPSISVSTPVPINTP